MDSLSTAARSERMSRVRGKDTATELTVRRLVHALGYRFRLHRRDLPGTPDLVFPGRRKVIFVHGCFWHGHNCARGARIPATNTDYWINKIARNRTRHEAVVSALGDLGWTPAVVWECETREPGELAKCMIQILGRKGP